jgi:hypothetical protein
LKAGQGPFRLPALECFCLRPIKLVARYSLKFQGQVSPISSCVFVTSFPCHQPSGISHASLCSIDISIRYYFQYIFSSSSLSVLKSQRRSTRRPGWRLFCSREPHPEFECSILFGFEILVSFSMLKRTHRSDSPDEFNRNSGVTLRRTLSIACNHRDAAVNREARAKAEGSQVGHEPRSTAKVGPGRNTNPIDLTTSPSSSFSRSLSSSLKSRSKKRRGSGSSGGPDGSQCSERARRSLTISLHGSSDSGSDCRRGRRSSGDSESAYVGERV